MKSISLILILYLMLSAAALAESAHAPEKEGSIDYMVLVNKLNPLPDGWEDALETVHVTNSVGDDVAAEKRAYEAYLALAADLEANDGIHTELDSGYRSVAEQQEIMERFTETYGADYAARTVATPGYSEHHTGLALDLYYIVDGKTVYKNEDLVQYPEIWRKIHTRLADHGFILRYLDGKEHITGYGYEPWHIRYIDDAQAARDIMSQPGMTLEVWLGAVEDTDPVIDYGSSALYSEADLEAADVQRLKDAGAEVVFALPHWGEEYWRRPEENTVLQAKKLVAAGVDVILGGHPHMVQPVEFVEAHTADGVIRTGLVAYSLGNFISNMCLQYTDSGIMLDFTLQERPEGGFAVENVAAVPVYCWRREDMIQALCSMRYLNAPPEGMSAFEWARLKESYTELRELIDENIPMTEG